MVKKLGKIAQYDKRFGLIAIEKGFITDDDLIKALIIQVKEENENGRHRLIGEILLDMDVMSDRQIEEVLMEIFR
jgi:hypothetical protein